MIVTDSSVVSSVGVPSSVPVASIAATTSMPSVICPNSE